MPVSESRLIVLVVEDEPLVRMLMADVLDEAGFMVFEAVDADEAMVVLQARSDVRALVTDIEMRGSMNGLDLARTVRERWPTIGIVVTSGRARPSPDDLSDKVVFLAKPCRSEVMATAVRQLV